ncbi:VOC family protein [candidate division KSB1 bacterium]|nr:VOC family protein [candidate division KSB1 bacterium]MBL7103497.1 VOC family protein [Bacteroidales bacterium]
MKLEHIALTIEDAKEIKDFYIDILEMKEVKTFVLNKILAQKIFGIQKDTNVFYLQRNNLFLEVFITGEKLKQGFDHICLSVKDRETIVTKAEPQNYECVRIKRDVFDLIFVKDKSGNIFEIKESNMKNNKI